MHPKPIFSFMLQLIEYKAGHLAVNTGEAFDHRASTWTSIASMAVKRSQHALAAIGYQLYAIAGLCSIRIC